MMSEVVGTTVGKVVGATIGAEVKSEQSWQIDKTGGAQCLWLVDHADYFECVGL